MEAERCERRADAEELEGRLRLEPPRAHETPLTSCYGGRVRLPDLRVTILPALVLVCLGVALSGSLACGATVRTASVRPAEEPRLVLPGNHLVRAGEWIDLRWSKADSISELEILLSTDGGRHYSECVSPQLDPGRCEFLWRVPPLGSGSLWLRLRFNRHGQEIEGAPASPLTVLAGTRNEPQPLGLPPFADAEGERAPGPPHSREESPAGRAATGLIGHPECFANGRKPPSEISSGVAHPTRTRPTTRGVASRFVAPRCTPLRA